MKVINSLEKNCLFYENFIMILEVEDETRDFITTYKKDYLRRRYKKSATAKPHFNFIPPLNACNAPFKEYLNSLRKNEKLPEDEQSENLRDYLRGLKTKFPHLKKFLPADTPDEDLLEQEQKKNFKTVYQETYSKDLDDYVSLTAQKCDHGRKPVSLPNDWVIPETIQRRSFRNPFLLAPHELLQTTTFKKALNNLGPDFREREILKVRTGNSEYQAVIGATGDRIIKEKMFGEPLLLEPLQIKDPQVESEPSSDLLHLKDYFISNVF